MADLAQLKIVVDTGEAQRNAKSLTGELKKVEAASDGVQKSVKATGSASTRSAAQLKVLEGGAKGASVAMMGLKSAMASLAIVASGLVTAFAGMRAVNMASEYQSLQGRIRLITRETGDYLAVSNQLYESSKRTGAALEDNVDVYQRLAGAAKSLGRSNQEALTVVENVNKLAAITNASKTARSAGLLQFGQGVTGQYFRAEEFNSLIENLPGVVGAIQKGLGVSRGELIGMVKDGKLLSKDVFEAILKQTEQIDRDFKQIPVTAERGFARVGTVMQKVIGEGFQKSGLNDAIVGILNKISDALEGIGGNADLAVIAFIGLAAAITAAGVAFTAGLGGTAALAAFAAISVAVGLIVLDFQNMQTEIENTQHVAITFADYAGEKLHNVMEIIRDFQEGVRMIGEAFNWTADMAKDFYGFLETAADPQGLAKGMLGSGSAGAQMSGGRSFTSLPDPNSAEMRAILRIRNEDRNRGLVNPSPGYPVTSGFGPRVSPGGQGSRDHKGIDIGVPVGTPVGAMRTGTVIFAGKRGGFGNLVVVKGELAGQVIEQEYAHLSRIDVKAGQEVYTGGRVGLSGGAPNMPGSGTSTGAHLHAGLKVSGRYVDPSQYLGVSSVRGKADVMAAKEDAAAKRQAKQLKQYKELLTFEETWAKKKQAAMMISKIAYDQTVKEYEAAKTAAQSKQELGGAEYDAILKRQQALKQTEQTISDIQAKREANDAYTQAVEARAAFRSGGEYGLGQYTALEALKNQIGQKYDTSTGTGAELFKKGQSVIAEEQGLQVDELMAAAQDQLDIETRLTDARRKSVFELQQQVLLEKAIADMKAFGKTGGDADFDAYVKKLQDSDAKRREQDLIGLNEETQRSIQYQNELKTAYEQGATFNSTTGQFEFDAVRKVNEEYERRNQLLRENLQIGTEAYNQRDAAIKKEQEASRVTSEAAQKAQETLNFQQQVGNLFASAFENAILGAQSFKEVLSGLLKDLARLLLNKFITGLFSKLFGGIFGGAGGLVPSAQGNVFNMGKVVPFASGGVVSSPTLFPMAGGDTGLMGEAGAEAIMPLSRDSRGNLGVKVSGGAGGATVVNVTNNINMAPTGDQKYDKEMIEKTTKAINDGVRATVIDENRRQLRAGGMFNNRMTV